jgi:hypothetical protein
VCSLLDVVIHDDIPVFFFGMGGTLQVSLLCHQYVEAKRAIFGGLSDGDLLLWKPKFAQKAKSEMVTVRLAGHKGRTMCSWGVWLVGS